MVRKREPGRALAQAARRVVRKRRGPISPREHFILTMVRDGKAEYGRQMVRYSEDHPAEGPLLRIEQIYINLNRLVQKKRLLDTELEKPTKELRRPLRRLYRLTAEGERVLAEADRIVRSLEKDLGAPPRAVPGRIK